MRTTVRLPSPIFQQAKIFAAQNSVTLTQMIEAGVRMFMEQQQKTSAKKEKISLPVCKSKKWLVKGVDLSDSTSVYEAMEEDDFFRC